MHRNDACIRLRLGPGHVLATSSEAACAAANRNDAPTVRPIRGRSLLPLLEGRNRGERQVADELGFLICPLDADLDEQTIVAFVEPEPDPGEVVVTATVFTGDEQAAEDTRAIAVTGEKTKTERRPQASFTFEVSGLEVFVDGSESFDPDGSVESYRWDFGDGNGDEGSTVQHTYAEPGTYPVTLIVTDDDGLRGEDVQEVTVQAPDRPETRTRTPTPDVTALTTDPPQTSDPVIR